MSSDDVKHHDQDEVAKHFLSGARETLRGTTTDLTNISEDEVLEKEEQEAIEECPSPALELHKMRASTEQGPPAARKAKARSAADQQQHTLHGTRLQLVPTARKALLAQMQDRTEALLSKMQEAAQTPTAKQVVLAPPARAVQSAATHSKPIEKHVSFGATSCRVRHRGGRSDRRLQTTSAPLRSDGGSSVDISNAFSSSMADGAEVLHELEEFIAAVPRAVLSTLSALSTTSKDAEQPKETASSPKKAGTPSGCATPPTTKAFVINHRARYAAAAEEFLLTGTSSEEASDFKPSIELTPNNSDGAASAASSNALRRPTFNFGSPRSEMSYATEDESPWHSPKGSLPNAPKVVVRTSSVAPKVVKLASSASTAIARTISETTKKISEAVTHPTETVKKLKRRGFLTGRLIKVHIVNILLAVYFLGFCSSYDEEDAVGPLPWHGEVCRPMTVTWGISREAYFPGLDRMLTYQLGIFFILINVIPKYMKRDLAERHKYNIVKLWAISPLFIHVIFGILTIIISGAVTVTGWFNRFTMFFVVFADLGHQISIYRLLKNHDGIWQLRVGNMALSVVKWIAVMRIVYLGDFEGPTVVIFIYSMGFGFTRLFCHIAGLINVMVLGKKNFDREHWYSIGLSMAQFYCAFRTQTVLSKMFWPVCVVCSHVYYGLNMDPALKMPLMLISIYLTWISAFWLPDWAQLPNVIAFYLAGFIMPIAHRHRKAEVIATPHTPEKPMLFHSKTA